jgi:regulator of replication initiation timing
MKLKIKEIRKGLQAEFIGCLVEKFSLLIENPKLRQKMGEDARWEVAYGKHSIRERNKKLKQVLDEATS